MRSPSGQLLTVRGKKPVDSIDEGMSSAGHPMINFDGTSAYTTGGVVGTEHFRVAASYAGAGMSPLGLVFGYLPPHALSLDDGWRKSQEYFSSGGSPLSTATPRLPNEVLADSVKRDSIMFRFLFSQECDRNDAAADIEKSPVALTISPEADADAIIQLLKQAFPTIEELDRIEIESQAASSVMCNS